MGVFCGAGVFRLWQVFPGGDLLQDGVCGRPCGLSAGQDPGMFFPTPGGAMSERVCPVGRYRGSETLGHGLFSGFWEVVSGMYSGLIWNQRVFEAFGFCVPVSPAADAFCNVRKNSAPVNKKNVL